MILSRYGTFTGGIDLPDEKQRTLSLPIHKPPAPSVLRVPLAPCGSAPAEPVVETGQRVSAGQMIAAARDASAVEVFAPLAGKVEGFTSAAVAGRYGRVISPAIELGDLSEPEDLPPALEEFDWRAADAVTLRSRITTSGLTTFSRAPERLGLWLRRAVDKQCRVLIANVMEGEPYVTAGHRLMVEHGRCVLRGLALLGRAMGAERLFLVADRRRVDDYRDSADPAELYGIEQVALPHKYPTDADAILVKILTRLEAPPGGGTMDVRSAVISAATCFAAYRRVGCGIPPTGRVVTVSGERAPRPGNFFAPFGMVCRELLGSVGAPVIHGGPMTGLKCDEDMVVGPATDAVLAIEAAPAPVPGPCIRCGWCRDRCPTRLNVAAINDAFELAQVGRAERLGAAACVGCGVCSYVCPARLPLTQRMKQLKRAVVERAAPVGPQAAPGEVTTADDTAAQ